MQDFDPVSAVGAPDPYPYYAMLAEQPALHWQPHLDMWLAAHPDLVRAALTHPDCRVRPPQAPVPPALLGGSAGEVFAALVRMNDGPAHAPARQALARALCDMRPEAVIATAHGVAAALRARCPLPQWAWDAPVACMASLLGFPTAQWPALTQAMARFVACLSPLSGAQQLAGAHAASGQLLAAAELLLAAPPTGSLAAAVAAEARQAGWAQAFALRANLVGLLAQTYEATAGLLGNCLVAMQRGMALAPGALAAHVARHDPPVHNTRRYAACRLALGNAVVEPGQGILVLLAAQPGQGFGHGAHACPGQALALHIVTGCLQALAGQPMPALRWQYRPSHNARLPIFTVAGEAA